jgi:hypothetical protein
MLTLARAPDGPSPKRLPIVVVATRRRACRIALSRQASLAPGCRWVAHATAGHPVVRGLERHHAP